MSQLASLTDLTSSELMILFGIILFASMVRGFAGFGLSAVVMASAVFILPPIQLIAMLWFVEMAASLVMFKGGIKDADISVTKSLIIGATCGLPVGLLLNLQLPIETSKVVALTLLILLAAVQLIKIRIPMLATSGGTYGAGLCAGIVTGFCGAGGMFIAIFMLARQMPSRTVRGTMSIYLLGGGILGLFTHLVIGTIGSTALARGMFFMIPTLIGLYIGRALFIERLERYYGPFCLNLLIVLASLGLIRTVSN